MLGSFRTGGDELVVAAIRDLPRVRELSDDEAVRLFTRAERHALAGVLLDAWREAHAALPASLAAGLEMREAARELDHRAHLAMLAAIDAELAQDGLRAVALKGVLLAERLYARPSSRPLGDIDLLVEEHALARATRLLAKVGYTPLDHPVEERFRNEGHHLHLVHERAPALELHFHAHRGFGRTLRGEPIVARAVAHEPFAALRVPSRADELVFLAVHAASHRFMRLGWLYDIVLLLARSTDADVAEAEARAREVGMRRPLALAVHLATTLFGVGSRRSLAFAGSSLAGRHALLDTLVEEPARPLARAATRFAYTLALCDDVTSALRYARGAAIDRITRRDHDAG